MAPDRVLTDYQRIPVFYNFVRAGNLITCRFLLPYKTNKLSNSLFGMRTINFPGDSCQNPKYHFITGNNIEKEITEFAEKNELDLLIIIPKKHSLANRMFQHSHSKQMVLHAHIPVMAIHE